MMKTSGHFREFAVLAFDSGSVRGCRFRRRGIRYAVERPAVASIDAADPARAWREVFRQLGRGKECPLFLTGALAGGFFFRFSSIELSPRARREALLMELPQRLPVVPENCRFQFFAEKAAPDGGVPVNVYAVPGDALEYLAAMLTQSGGRADEFLYPLLAVRGGDPPVDLSRIDPDFGFAEGEWRPIAANPDLTVWEEEFKAGFLFPEDGGLRVGEYFECLLAARLVVSPSFRQQERALAFLPSQLRPKRLRNQLGVTALLAGLLLVNYLWMAAGAWHDNFERFRRIDSERARLQTENAQLARRARILEKEQRELTRVVNSSAGEADVLAKLAALTSILPSNVMVSSLRWSESSLDLMLQSEAENLDLAALFRRLPYWKVSQLQQRRMGDTVTMVTVKLVPAGKGTK